MYKLSEKYKKYVKYKEIKNLKKTLAFPVALLYTKQVARVRRKNIGNGRLVKRLRRRPLTAKTGVRFPYRLLEKLLVIQELFVLSYCGEMEGTGMD